MFTNEKFYWGIAIFLAGVITLSVIELLAPGTIIPAF